MWMSSGPYVDEWAGDELGGDGFFGEGVEDFEDMEGPGGSQSSEGSSEDESGFNDHTMNVEVPLSWIEGGSEVAAPDVEPDVDEAESDEVEPVASPYVRLHLLREELGGGGSTSTAGMVLSRQVWRGSLPLELVEEVLLWLPTSVQARCRAVCKAWRSLLASSESFLHSLTRVTTPLCAFEYSHGPSEPHEWSVRAPKYKTEMGDLSFLPPVFQSESTEIHSCSPHGLMCMGRKQDERDEMHFCVLNPVNQSFKVLPMLENFAGQAVLMTEAINATGSVHSFKVLCFEYHHFWKRRKMAIYSSMSGEWKGLEARPNNESELPEYEDAGLPFACDGAIYTVVGKRLVELSTETGSRYLWDLPLPYFERRGDQGCRADEWMEEFYLADHRGRLLCCCGGIWELDVVKREWNDVAKRCPPDILPPCNPAEDLTLDKVQVYGDLVVFFHRVPGKDGPVAYNMLQRCWQKMPVGIGKVQGVFQAMPDLQL